MLLFAINLNIYLNFFHMFRLLTAGREKRPTKSLVVGRPILLALEDIDGSPSFLEKALCFLEKHGRTNQCSLSPKFGTWCTLLLQIFYLKYEYFLAGIKVEGILRQAADVEEVDRRLQEYEQGFCRYFLYFDLVSVLLHV
jgi:hypothetical protein